MGGKRLFIFGAIILSFLFTFPRQLKATNTFFESLHESDEDHIIQDLTNYKIKEKLKDRIAELSNYSTIFEYAESKIQTSDKICRTDFQFYVYDDLPSEFTDEIENKILAQIKNKERLSENIATEWALVQLFRTSPCRTLDPKLAKYYVVPYMHYADCFYTEGYEVACGQVETPKMFHLFDSLEFYGKLTKDRHVFIQGYDEYMSNKIFKKRTPLKLVVNSITSTPDHVVVPIFHDGPEYQPGALLSHDFQWWTRTRTYSFAVINNIKLNRSMLKIYKQGRIFRRVFHHAMNEAFPDQMFAGKPFFMEAEVIPDPFSIYRDSILCPVLPGDNSWQRRFFDVIRNGCIPVVLEWTLDDGKGKSWYTPFDPVPIELAYPFVERGIHYDSFVVTAPYNKTNFNDMSSIINTMKSVLNDPYDIQQRQERMMYYAPYMTYGLGPDAHVFQDGFSQILVELKDKLK